MLCANELAQIYTIIAADKVSQQCLLCVLAFDTAATATASAGVAVVHHSLYAGALLQTELLQQIPSVYRHIYLLLLLLLFIAYASPAPMVTLPSLYENS